MRRGNRTGYAGGIIGLCWALGMALAGACTPEPRDFGSSSSSGGGGVCKAGTSEPCYTGPAGTEDTGLCKRGTHECLPDGSGFGECGGEVVPQKEDCTTPEDEACDGADSPKVCPPLGHVWSASYGGMTLPGLTAVAVDPSGNIVMVGSFTGTLDLGGGQLASTGSADIFITKRSPLGEHIWSKRFGDASAQRSSTVAIDAKGAIYIGGSVQGSIDFGDGKVLTSAGSDDAFVTKLDGDGNLVWAKLFGDASAQSVARLALTPAGQIVAAGQYAGTMTFDNGKMLTSAGSDDVFVIKLDASGFTSQTRSFGGMGVEEVNGLAVDSQGAVVITGRFTSATIDFGNGALTNAGGDDAFVAKLSPLGSGVWSKAWGDATSQRGLSVAFAPNDEPIVTGTMEGTVDFGNGPKQAPAMAESLYLTRLSADGNAVWSSVFGGPNSNAWGSWVAVAPSGRIVLSGWFNDQVDLGGGPFVSQGQVDIFLAEFDPEGIHVASKAIGTMDEEGVFGLALASDGGPVVSGLYYTTGPDFGGGPLPTGGGVKKQDIRFFLARFLP
jgi:hypothetical protein